MRTSTSKDREAVGGHAWLQQGKGEEVGMEFRYLDTVVSLAKGRNRYE